MRVESFRPAPLVSAPELTASESLLNLPPPQPPTPGRQEGPGQLLGKALGQVNSALHEADRQAQQVATGQATNLHDSLLAMAEADLALQVTMRVTQKALAAYQEISRMQI